MGVGVGGCTPYCFCLFIFYFSAWLIVSLFYQFKEKTYHFGLGFELQSRNGLARDIFDTFATHAGLAYDVTGKRKMATLSIALS